jgi:hypothetical protein
MLHTCYSQLFASTEPAAGDPATPTPSYRYYFSRFSILKPPSSHFGCISLPSRPDRTARVHARIIRCGSEGCLLYAYFCFPGFLFPQVRFRLATIPSSVFRTLRAVGRVLRRPLRLSQATPTPSYRYYFSRFSILKPPSPHFFASSLPSRPDRTARVHARIIRCGSEGCLLYAYFCFPGFLFPQVRFRLATTPSSVFRTLRAVGRVLRRPLRRFSNFPPTGVTAM